MTSSRVGRSWGSVIVTSSGLSGCGRKGP
ncbi:lipoprotein [Blastococcus sp. SYSU DS1024]